MRRLPLLFVALLLVSCMERGEFTLGSEAQECSLTLDALPGTSWVMLEPVYGKGDVPNPQARARFYVEDGKARLSYTVKSMGDVYEYTCERRGEELVCLQDLEPYHAEAMCRALEAHAEGSCTVAKLEEIGTTGLTDAQVKAAVAAAKKEAEEARGGDSWQVFVARNNNVGNKVQGKFYVKIDDRKCRLRVSDMYVGLFDGETFEDSNVVGTNPFVESDDDLLWEHCPDGRSLVDTDSADRPGGRLDPNRSYALGEEVHYHYTGDAAVKPESGCVYSVDRYAQWKAVDKNVEAPVAGGRVDWHTTHTWTDGEAYALVNPFDPRAIYTLVRYKQCGDGDREQIDVVCNAAKIVVPGAAPEPE